jgi:MFS superfamily sulfate permease-like transporter
VFCVLLCVVVQALKAEVGGKTPFANIITSLFVTIVLVWATRLLYYVPMAVLGAVICTAVLSLFDFKGASMGELDTRSLGTVLLAYFCAGPYFRGRDLAQS